MAVTFDLLIDEDVPAALALSTAEGWNQTEADWRRLTRLEPAGCFAAREDHRLIGTVTTTTYQRDLAWIGMVIVDPNARERGIGRALMRLALEYLASRGVATIKLDATPAGRPLYESLGFVAEADLERWQGPAPSTKTPESPRLNGVTLEHVLRLDQGAYGADRSRLVELLAADAAAGPLLAESDSGAPTAYALARRGRIATYFGPMVATEPHAAHHLLGELLRYFAGDEVCFDLYTSGLLRRVELAASGLTKRRTLTRMRLGPPNDGECARFVCLSAGPEYG